MGRAPRGGCQSRPILKSCRGAGGSERAFDICWDCAVFLDEDAERRGRKCAFEVARRSARGQFQVAVQGTILCTNMA
eukprot:11216186-Lingulodinium_polyedra.AAC.1